MACCTSSGRLQWPATHFYPGISNFRILRVPCLAVVRIFNILLNKSVLESKEAVSEAFAPLYFTTALFY